MIRGMLGSTVAWMLVAFALVSTCGALSLRDPLPLSPWTNGTSFFFGGPQDGKDDPYNFRLPAGACGYGEMDSKLWPFYFVMGISPKSDLVHNRPQASCGTCLEVRCASTDPKVCGSRKSITVVITDECPQCAANELNMHAFAFQQLASLDYGSTDIQYRQVECSPVDNVTVHVDNFRVVQGGWLRLSLKSVASDGGVVRVELARSMDVGVSNSTGSDGAAPSVEAGNTTAQVWKDMDNTYGAEWEVSVLPDPPYDLRVTDTFGRRVVLTRAIMKSGAIGEFPGHGQFPPLDNATVSNSTAGNAVRKVQKGAVNSTTAAVLPSKKAPVAEPNSFVLVGARRQLRQGTRGQQRGPMP